MNGSRWYAPAHPRALDGRRARVALRAEEDVFVARRAARAIASAAGLAAAPVERVATAVSEIARNAVVHGHGGEVTVEPVEEGGRRGVLVVVRDRGPGIPDVARALEDGFSTGGSLGLGLSGARRLMDELSIESAPGEGTTVTMRKWVDARR